jgi:hypothetical protein
MYDVGQRFGFIVYHGLHCKAFGKDVYMITKAEGFGLFCCMSILGIRIYIQFLRKYIQLSCH